MIDFHCHVIPKIDDGASDVQESLAILKALEKQGVNTVVATPHYYDRHVSVNTFLNMRKNALDMLAEHYDGNIKIVAGSEINIATCLNADLTDLLPLSIEGTNYALVEMSFERDWNGAVWKRLEDFIGKTYLIPIIAHVEKYPAVLRRPEYASRLVDMGCLLQVNCDSVIEGQSGSFIDALLKHNLAYCLGSDAHNVSSRPPRYKEAVKKIKDAYGEDVLCAIQNNMSTILMDGYVGVGSYSRIKKSPFRKVYS